MDAVEAAAVAVGKLDGKLGFAEAAHAGQAGGLGDGGGVVVVEEGAREGEKFVFTAGEEGIAREGQARAGRQGAGERGRVRGGREGERGVLLWEEKSQCFSVEGDYVNIVADDNAALDAAADGNARAGYVELAVVQGLAQQGKILYAGDPSPRRLTAWLISASW